MKKNLAELLSLNQNLFIMAILMDKLKAIWGYKRRGWAKKVLVVWCAIARLVGYKKIKSLSGDWKKTPKVSSDTANIPSTPADW